MKEIKIKDFKQKQLNNKMILKASNDLKVNTKIYIDSLKDFDFKSEYEDIGEFINDFKKKDLSILIKKKEGKCLFFKNNRFFIRKTENGDYLYTSYNEEQETKVFINVLTIISIFYGLRLTKTIMKLMRDYDIKIKQLEWWDKEREKIFNNIEILNDEDSLEQFNGVFYDYFKTYMFFLKEFQMIALNNTITTDKKGEPIFFSSVRYIENYLKNNRIKFSKSQIIRVINAMAVVGIIEKVDFNDIDDKITSVSKNNLERLNNFNDIAFYKIKEINTKTLRQSKKYLLKLKKNNVSVMKVNKKNVAKYVSRHLSRKIFNNQNATGKHNISDKLQELPF